jgi:uncharacterized protein (TIGR04255 family)
MGIEDDPDDEMNVNELPAYDNPPAVETVMGLHFVQIAGWNPLHLGQLHSDFQADYPNGEMLAPVVDVTLANRGAELNRIESLPMRAAFSDDSKAQLVQVQPSFFMRNWRRVQGVQQYEHYSDLKPRFMRDWARFKAFLNRVGLSSPEVYRVEVTYVNHLIRGDVWNSYNDLAGLLKPLAERAKGQDHGRHYAFLPEAATMNLAAGYNLPALDVNLQIQVQPVIRQPEGTEAIQFTVTGRSKPDSSGEDGLTKALDRCHDAVILGFDDATTSKAHSIWGRR